MRIDGRDYRTIWLDESGSQDPADARVRVIDQTRLPHRFETLTLDNSDEASRAIRDMAVRGAPLIGVTGAYGLALAAAADAGDAAIEAAYEKLLATRPTAVNLRWGLDRVKALLLATPVAARAAAAFAEAGAIAEEDVACCASIGDHGAALIRDAAEKNPGRPVNILTHCNAGWLATVDWGTALAPIYKAARAGIGLHVWVDETRPRNQGASLTAFELLSEGVPHTVIADNAGGHLMQHGMVDLCIVGTDRTTRTGDVCNKIGTYLKALAAHDNGVPFYVALPSSTIDWRIEDGVANIPIEERSAREVTHVSGRAADGAVTEVLVTPEGSSARNWAFDVTPAKYVTGLITERGVCAASEAGLRGVFSDLAG
ncbi:S-methyl-5-thioribose-1-phosphate isomerase [Methylocystis parvus]|uniref:Methylthioribose-1-phosphate isomerase n=1 Tax=Methylocystis parvus TaxID=134 RepID=A0A6B8M315_9HYPH|nr:S-methyl-5-thioribose-1-phosphate isomerase [Methylocystis parvus]QGM96179.1 S-methyl-5-thioribose-1-phosphate isomerase [Methylocystis parvus]WBJ99995.1 S-methyl-5-thioribose-1-phosphate isomerase [Methylocystis parvus OBBP]